MNSVWNLKIKICSDRILKDSVAKKSLRRYRIPSQRANKIAWQTYLMHQSFNQNSINIYFTTDCKTYRMDLHPHDWPVPCRRRPMQWSSPKNASKPGNTWSPQPMQATTGAGYRPMVRTDYIDYSRTKIPWSCHSVSIWLLYNLRWAKSINGVFNDLTGWTVAVRQLKTCSFV